MQHNSQLKIFQEDENGAVTVDWVVLVACLVALTLAVLPVIWWGVGDTRNNLASNLATAATFSAPGENTSGQGQE